MARIFSEFREWHRISRRRGAGTGRGEEGERRAGGRYSVGYATRSRSQLRVHSRIAQKLFGGVRGLIARIVPVIRGPCDIDEFVLALKLDSN
ncbi:unnamed protein product [Pieris brassicae]|uniref:Uncharacterized protein n=1 Tax=Pieris brassicae TaxID=7116 RepID=A0A9P0TKA4_PIEBR|nr:unnamed protein product [Pieris brassicae]